MNGKCVQLAGTLKKHCGAKSFSNFHMCFIVLSTVDVDYLGTFPSAHCATAHILFATLNIRHCTEGSSLCVCNSKIPLQLYFLLEKGLLQLAGDETSIKMLVLFFIIPK
uniref:Uncharacterized protein n=1 Tax=Micrurus lemniscatus lemniscatus TaxID=129467 RepID=A0A2D4II35_MICLE